jgi:hypothetical protein
MPSLKLTRLMSLVSILETLCLHSRKMQDLACARNQNHSFDTVFVSLTDNKHIFQEPCLAPKTINTFSKNLVLPPKHTQTDTHTHTHTHTQGARESKRKSETLH